MNGRIVLVFLVAASIALSAGVHRRIQDQTLDKTGMENPYAFVTELLKGRWESEDGIFSAVLTDNVQGIVLSLSREDEVVFFGSFSHEGTDPKVKTTITPSPQQYAPEGGTTSCLLQDLYVEAEKLFAEFTLQRDGESEPFSLVLLKQEDDALLPVPDTSELVELSWYQNAMSYSDCFSFDIRVREDEALLSCSCTDPEDGAQLETDDEGIPVSKECMEELASFLKETAFTPYIPPDPYLADATNSRLSLTWREQETVFTNVCAGKEELRELLTRIAKEALNTEEN